MAVPKKDYGNTVVIPDHNLGVHFYADLSAWELSKNLSPLITLSKDFQVQHYFYAPPPIIETSIGFKGFEYVELPK